MRWLYKLLSIIGDMKSARRGVRPFLTRQARKQGHKTLSSFMRRWLK